MGRLSFWLADSHFVGCHFFRFKFPQIKPHPWHKVFRSRTSQEAHRIWCQWWRVMCSFPNVFDGFWRLCGDDMAWCGIIWRTRWWHDVLWPGRLLSERQWTTSPSCWSMIQSCALLACNAALMPADLDFFLLDGFFLQKMDFLPVWKGKSWIVMLDCAF